MDFKIVISPKFPLLSLSNKFGAAAYEKSSEEKIESSDLLNEHALPIFICYFMFLCKNDSKQ